MAVSYVESITSEFYRLKGYFISTDVAYQVPKEVTGKKVSGWKDIDVLAVDEKEALIIECKSFLGYENSEDVAKTLIQDFSHAERVAKDIPLIKGRQIKRILVADFSVEKVEKELEKNDIKVYLLKNLMSDFLELLKEKVKPDRIGKEENPITRTLIFLLLRGFLK